MASPKKKAAAKTSRRLRDLESKKNPKGGGIHVFRGAVNSDAASPKLS
jgi:hypothetical protein